MTPRNRLLRRLSLILLLAWVGVLVVSFAERRLRHRAPMNEAEVEDVGPQGEDQAVRVHRDFVYTDTIGIEPNFRIAARETIEFASGWYELRDVEISIYNRGEVAYGLAADVARYQKEKNEAVVRGEAQLSLAGGATMRAEGFVLHGRERLLESLGPVTFAGPGWAGVAGRASSTLADDTFELSDRVTLSWQSSEGTDDGFVLLAPRLRYVRRRAEMLFPEGVTVLRGMLRLHAADGTTQLSGPEGRPQRVRLNGGVDLRGTLGDGSEVSGDALSADVTIRADGDMALSLAENPATGWVTMEWRSPGGVGWRRLQAWRIVGEGDSNDWRWLEGQGLACLTEYMAAAPGRHLESPRLRVDFASGKPSVATAEDGVTIEWGERWARGETMNASFSTSSMTLRPAPGDRVELGGPGLEARCDELAADPDAGLVAEGDVTGSMERGTLWAQEGEVVRFAAGTLRFDRTGDIVVLETDARIWQGERLLRADTLTYDTARATVAGHGNVVVTATVPGAGGGPARISSRRLNYDERASLVTFEGGVALQDARSVVKAQRLVVTLGPDGEVLLGVFEGGVTITEIATSRTITAKRARMVADEDLVELWGEPVLVQEPSGNQIKAQHLKWMRATDSLVVVGGEDNPSETLYHPEKATPTPSARREERSTSHR